MFTKCLCTYKCDRNITIYLCMYKWLYVWARSILWLHLPATTAIHYDYSAASNHSYYGNFQHWLSKQLTLCTVDAIMSLYYTRVSFIDRDCWKSVQHWLYKMSVKFWTLICTEFPLLLFTSFFLSPWTFKLVFSLIVNCLTSSWKV